MTATMDPRAEKYSIPRHKEIPDTTLFEILSSEPVWKTADGKTDGQAWPFYLADDPALPKSAMVKPGKLFPFKIGAVYVHDESRTEVSKLFEAAASGMGLFMLPGLAELTGPLSKVAEIVGEAVVETVEEKIREPNSHSPTTIEETIETLQRRGMIVMPGVNLVEAEHQIDPGGFFSKERHRVLLTYEGFDGQRARYGSAFSIRDRQLAVNGVRGMIEIMLRQRQYGELDYYAQKVKGEYVPNSAAIESEMIADYQKRYGENIAAHIAEFMPEFNARMDSELERNGFTMAKAAQRTLEHLGPLVESYEKVIVLRDMIKVLREVAAGKT